MIAGEAFWLGFFVVALVAIWGFLAVFGVVEEEGIKTGHPATRYLRGWLRSPSRLTRYTAYVAILGTLAVLIIGGIWLVYHLTLECTFEQGIGCDNTN